MISLDKLHLNNSVNFNIRKLKIINVRTKTMLNRHKEDDLRNMEDKQQTCSQCSVMAWQTYLMFPFFV